MTWTDAFKTVIAVTISVLGGGGLVFALSSWLGKVWAARILEEERALHIRELEGYKSDLDRLKKEHEVKFSRLHEERAKIVAKIYRRLVKVQNLADQFVSSSTRVADAAFDEQRRELAAAMKRFYDYFDRNRIYLEDSLCKRIDDYHTSVIVPVSRVEMVRVLTDAKPTDVQRTKDESLEAIITKVQPIREQLEKEFRLIFGVIADNSFTRP